MRYDRFEDLPAWKAAHELVGRVYALTRDGSFAQPGDLRDQLRRASLSVSNNIAEGFERGTTAELLMFLYIARGSAGEVRSMLHLVQRLRECSHLKPEIADLTALAESCSRQLRGWAESLQNSDIKGQRHLNDQTRKTFEHDRRSTAFWNQLEQEHRQRVEQWARRLDQAPDLDERAEQPPDPEQA